MNNRKKEITAYFRNLDRGFFMEKHKDLAGLDEAIPIGHKQTISQPSLVLKMTLALDLKPTSKVLEIGTGSGFQTALLAKFSDAVYTVERIEELHKSAQKHLAEAGFDNIHFKLDDGSYGWAEHAPFDRIMVTAAAAIIPQELIEQLKPGGKMLIPVGSSFMQDLQLVEKDEQGKLHKTVIDNVLFVPLKGKYE
ncbi:MAG TPA: protein-L-isoaspartate(D-aspartate) O-methyltransferase [Planococcus sp. (in: firmicutes)]|nr:protein-L-isoaspartate(D-aspartate) O-methyltransferase [Planococcus sp. (in: firmicutes)]